MVLSPLNVTLSHVNTIAKMKEVLQTVAGLDVPESLVKVLDPTVYRLALRKKQIYNLHRHSSSRGRPLDALPMLSVKIDLIRSNHMYGQVEQRF